MSELVRTTPHWLVMIFIPDGLPVETVTQRVLTAALRLAASCKWLSIAEPQHCGYRKPGLQRAGDVGQDQCRVRCSATAGRGLFPILNPPRSSGGRQPQKQSAEWALRSAHAGLPAHSRAQMCDRP